MPSRLYGRLASDRVRGERTAQGNYEMTAQVEDWDRRVVLNTLANRYGENIVSVEAGPKTGSTNRFLSINLTTGEVETAPMYAEACELLKREE